MKASIEKFVDIGEDGGYIAVIKYEMTGKYYPATLENPAEYPEAEWELDSVHDADNEDTITDPQIIKAVDKYLDLIASEVSGDCEDDAGRNYEPDDGWDEL